VICEKEGDKELVKIVVASGQERPYYVKKFGLSPKGAFIRTGSASEPMTVRMIEDLFTKRLKTSIRMIESPEQELRFELLQIYYSVQGKKLKSNFFKTLDFFTSTGEFNYIAYLMSDTNRVSVKVAKYGIRDRVDLMESEEFGYNSIIKSAKQVLDKVDVENKTLVEITPKERKENKLWDPIALREAIINAFVHNDYTYELAPKFELFPDRIEITSYGALPQGLSEEEFFQGVSMPRNIEIMRIFKDLDLVEQLGSGIPRILQSYPQSSFHFSENFIRMTFPKFVLVPNNMEETKAEINGGVNGGVSGGVSEVLKCIELNPGIRSKTIQTVLQIKQRTLERYLENLRKTDQIKFIGPPKTGGYFQVNKDNQSKT
jgi:predicted HTH transcriptional regulator